LINSKWGQRIIKPLSRRAAQPHLNAEQVKSLELISPPVSVLQQFEKRLTNISNLREVAVTTKQHTETLFNSLLAATFN